MTKGNKTYIEQLTDFAMRNQSKWDILLGNRFENAWNLTYTKDE